VSSIPFFKAHGAQNDFLLTWGEDVPAGVVDLAALAKAICNRNTGVGADGWITVTRSHLAPGAGLPPRISIQLWNSDGSRSEISGNGTRCAAALVVDSGDPRSEIPILTGAGVKTLKLMERNGREFLFEMNMGSAHIEDVCSGIAPGREAVILNVGNPQCAVFCRDFDFDWKSLGAELERHPRFPERTNVSFVRVLDRHTLDVRFFERGAGETKSSGTGSTGAAAAAFARGMVDSPVEVRTPAGPLRLRWHFADMLLCGPAEIVANGEFYWKDSIKGDARK
jgi:diaminopimelate epimerase